MRKGTNAAFHWMEARVAWWPVLKKWKEPSMARRIGPIAVVELFRLKGEEQEIVRLFASRISSRLRIWHAQMAMENWPMGGSRTDIKRMKMGRSMKYRVPWTLA